MEESCVRTEGLSSEAEGLRLGHGAGGGAAPRGAIPAGPAAARLSCNILNTSSEHFCRVSINPFTSSAWLRALGYLILTRYSDIWRVVCVSASPIFPGGHSGIIPKWTSIEQ